MQNLLLDYYEKRAINNSLFQLFLLGIGPSIFWINKWYLIIDEAVFQLDMERWAEIKQWTQGKEQDEKESKGIFLAHGH